MYVVELVVSWGPPQFVRRYDELHEAVQYAKFLNECNRCSYIVVDKTRRVWFDTRTAPECVRWQESGF